MNKLSILLLAFVILASCNQTTQEKQEQILKEIDQVEQPPSDNKYEFLFENNICKSLDQNALKTLLGAKKIATTTQVHKDDDNKHKRTDCYLRARESGMSFLILRNDIPNKQRTMDQFNFLSQNDVISKNSVEGVEKFSSRADFDAFPAYFDKVNSLYLFPNQDRFIQIMNSSDDKSTNEEQKRVAIELAKLMIQQ